MKYKNLHPGRLIYYNDELYTTPDFMMWKEIEDDGYPILGWTSSRWSKGNVGIVIGFLKIKKSIFLCVVTSKNDVGWILPQWVQILK